MVKENKEVSDAVVPVLEVPRLEELDAPKEAGGNDDSLFAEFLVTGAPEVRRAPDTWKQKPRSDRGSNASGRGLYSLIVAATVSGGIV